jgi:hypothetical protein
VPDVAVGEVVHVERLAAPVLARDHHARRLGVDREHLGGVSIKAIGAVVVAGELDAVAGAELLGCLGEGLGMGGAAVVGPALLGDEADGAGFGVDGLDAVAFAGLRLAFSDLRKVTMSPGW